MTRIALTALALTALALPSFAAVNCGDRPPVTKVPAGATAEQLQNVYKDLDAMRAKTTSYVSCLNKEAYDAQLDYKNANDAYNKASQAVAAPKP